MSTTDSGGGADPAQRVVVRRLDGFPALLRHLADGSTVLVGLDGEELPALRSGERLMITRPIEDDATYVQPARVLEVLPDQEGVPVRAGGESAREQQRESVRVRTDPTFVTIAGVGGGEDSGGEMRDISAGGMRVTDASPPVGARVRLLFGLPDPNGPAHPMELDAEVMWTGTLGQDLPAVGLRFLDVDRPTEQLLASWVLRQQSRRTKAR